MWLRRPGQGQQKVNATNEEAHSTEEQKSAYGHSFRNFLQETVPVRKKPPHQPAIEVRFSHCYPRRSVPCQLTGHRSLRLAPAGHLARHLAVLHTKQEPTYLGVLYHAN